MAFETMSTVAASASMRSEPQARAHSDSGVHRGVAGEEAPEAAPEAVKRTEVSTRPSRDSVEGVVAEANEYLATSRHRLRFSVDDDSGRTVVKLLDPETDEVIKQIPSEQMLSLSKHIRESLEPFGLDTGVLLEDEV